MQSSIEYALRNAGLSEKEANLYFALLQLGPSSILAMARKAGMKRPTAYLILEELIQKGLISQVPKEKKKLFIALSPDRLLDTLQERTKTLQDTLPQLLAFYRGQTDKPFIQIFESKEGMLNVYRDITKDKSVKEILAFVAPEAVPKEFDENWDLFAKLFSKRGVRGRELMTAASLNHPYLKKTRRLPNYEARYAADNTFLSDTIIYKNKVVIFSFRKGFALIIESDDVAQSFRSLFEMAWRLAISF